MIALSHRPVRNTPKKKKIRYLKNYRREKERRRSVEREKKKIENLKKKKKKI